MHCANAVCAFQLQMPALQCPYNIIEELNTLKLLQIQEMPGNFRRAAVNRRLLYMDKQHVIVMRMEPSKLLQVGTRGLCCPMSAKRPPTVSNQISLGFMSSLDLSYKLRLRPSDALSVVVSPRPSNPAEPRLRGRVFSPLVAREWSVFAPPVTLCVSVGVGSVGLICA